MPNNTTNALQAGSPSQQQGRLAEDHALQLLLSAGHQLLLRNFYGRCGEIDLITHDDGGVLVFTEVRWRRHSAQGGAFASIGAAKQKRLIRSARLFLMHNPQEQRRIIRFDVIGFDGMPPHWQMHWLTAAFNAF